RGNHEITGASLDNLKAGSFPTPFLNYKERGSTVELVRKDTTGGRAVHVVLLKPKSGPVAQCFFDAENYLLVKMVVALNIPQSTRELQQTTECLDYRDQAGTKLPFQIKIASPMQAPSI